MSQQSLRNHLKELLTWSSAHVDLERAVKNVPTEYRGRRLEGAPYSLWQMLEHIRRAQEDILAFCRNPEYTSPNWPDDFWPEDPEPPSREDWQRSIDAIKRDRQELIEIIENPDRDLWSTIFHGEGQTYAREALLTADHTAYHVGQIVLLRRLLGIWPP